MAYYPIPRVDDIVGASDNSALSAAMRTALGMTAAGNALATLPNPGSISFLRLNADNTATARSAVNFRSDFGLGTGDSPTFAGMVASTGDILAASGVVSGYNVSASNAIRLGSGVAFQAGATGLTTTGYLGFAASNATLGPDLTLHRGAANTLYQRNGTAAQTFLLANTYTDDSNYERGIFGFASNVLRIGTENAGTGTLRAVNIIGSALQINGVAGATATLTTITGITVTNGIVTAITGS